jgi:hypothetical protein
VGELLSAIDAGMASTRLLWLGAEPVTGCTPSFAQIYTTYSQLYLLLQIQSMSAMTYFGM